MANTTELTNAQMREITNQILGIGAFILQTPNLAQYITQMQYLKKSKSAPKYVSLASIIDTAKINLEEIQNAFRDDELVTDLLDKEKSKGIAA